MRRVWDVTLAISFLVKNNNKQVKVVTDEDAGVKTVIVKSDHQLGLTSCSAVDYLTKQAGYFLYRS